MRSQFAPALPRWVLLEREAAMQVDDLIRKCVAFLGVPAPNGDFIGYGTAFCY